MTPQKEARLLFRLDRVTQVRVADITIQDILSEQVPDVNKFLQVLDRIPLEKRAGKLAVPELQSLRPPEPVEIIFYPSDDMVFDQ